VDEWVSSLGLEMAPATALCCMTTQHVNLVDYPKDLFTRFVGQDYPDQRVHASGMGQSECEGHR
jgi:hypothetical protein